MKIRFACPSCAAEGVVDDAFVGKQARCKHCGHRSTIRAPGDMEADVYTLDEPAALPAVEDAWNPEPEPRSAFVPSPGDAPSTPSAPRRPKRDPSRPAARDRAPGFAWGKWLFRGAAVVAVALVGIAVFAPRGPLIAGSMMMALGSLMVLVGYLAGAYGAFREDFLYGFLYLVVPLYTAYYMVTRWEDLWPWLVCSTAGVGLVLLGTEVVRPFVVGV